MGWFSFARDERFILASLGAVTLSTIAMMRFLLIQYRDSAVIKPVQPKTQYITQDTEDSLKLGTLETLLGHYNYAIRDTAAKIVCDRSVNDGVTVNNLLWGITRPNYDERMKNLRALAMITDQRGYMGSKQRKSDGWRADTTIDSLHLLNNRKAYLAFVRSLELCAQEADYSRLDDNTFDDYILRDMSEKMLLMFLLQLINKYDPQDLVRAKFIEKWLVKQNWGDSDEERQKNFDQYMHHHQNRITELYARIQATRLGIDALEKAKLIPKGRSMPVPNNRISVVLSISMNELGEDQEVTIQAEGHQPRPMEQSVEEQRLRRQHREAMVLNDGSRPFGREDIFEREHE